MLLLLLFILPDTTRECTLEVIRLTYVIRMLDNMDDSSSTGVPPSLIEPALLELVSYDESSRPVRSNMSMLKSIALVR